MIVSPLIVSNLTRFGSLVNRTLLGNIWDIFLPEKLLKNRGLSMEVSF